MTQNYIIFLGGSITQSSNFEYLKKKKYKIILIDKNSNCYCKKYSDIFLNVSHTETEKILKLLEKILYQKKYKIIDCFGTAHYSFHSVNMIKLKYIKNSFYDKFLLHKHIQRKKLKNNSLIPQYLLLPSLSELIKKKKNYISRIYNFYKDKNYNIYVKSDGKHQGEGIIRLNGKISKTLFTKKYFKLILGLFKNTKDVYLEEKVDGQLLNIDFIKKKGNNTIFLPLIYRDRVILNGKKKFLSVFQYLNDYDSIKKKHYDKIKSILFKLYKNTQAFGTMDVIVNNEDCRILEISPHFHNSKIHKFLNNNDLLDLYLTKNKKKIKNFKKTNKGGYIFVHEKNNYTKKMTDFVKKYSQKVLIDNIDLTKRKTFLNKNASIKNGFHLIYFKTKTDTELNIISDYLEKNKNYLY